jgi:hypothetical protein
VVEIEVVGIEVVGIEVEVVEIELEIDVVEIEVVGIEVEVGVVEKEEVAVVMVVMGIVIHPLPSWKLAFHIPGICQNLEAAVSEKRSMANLSVEIPFVLWSMQETRCQLLGAKKYLY